jgi:hypothetical protein
MWSLAKRFSPHPLWAALLFLAVPAFVVNGNSLESDLPFLAFWMAAVACFVAGRWMPAAIAMALAALSAFQAVFLTPILAVYVWLYRREDRTAWLLTLVPPATILALGIVRTPVVRRAAHRGGAGYMSSYGLQALANKLRSAAALTVHACFMVFPALLPGADPAGLEAARPRNRLPRRVDRAVLRRRSRRLFFAGSARYLLPMAAPVALLASRLRPRWLALGFAAQLALSLALATVNYQHWDGYRRFARQIRAATAGHRVYIDGEWGLRYYLEADGGLPLERGQVLRAGDIVVSSQLAYPIGSPRPPRPSRAGHSRLAPLQLIGLESHSGYSTASKGLRPFDISTAPIDIVRAAIVLDRHPTLTYLPMNAPEAPTKSSAACTAWKAAHGVGCPPARWFC